MTRAFLMLCVAMSVWSSVRSQTVHFTAPSNTGVNATIAIPASVIPTIDHIGIAKGDEIGVFTTSGLCAGAVVWTGSAIGLVVWGDNQFTPEIDGMQPNEVMKFRIWQKQTNTEFSLVTVSYASGSALFVANGLYVLSALSALTPPPDAPILVTPADSAVDVDLNPTLQWLPAPRAATYFVVLSRDSTFQTTGDTGTVAVAQRKIAGLSEKTTYFWRVRSANPNGQSSFSSVFRFRTLWVNVKPVFTHLLDYASVDEGKNFSFTFTAVDANGDSVTYALIGVVPSGASINSATGAFTWTPAIGQSGLYTVTVKASDPSGLFNTTSFVISVNPVIRPPVLTHRVPDASIDSVTAGTQVAFSVTTVDPDSTPVTYTWKVNGAIVKQGMDSTYTTVFHTLGVQTQVACVFTDAGGASDSTQWSFLVVQATSVSIDRWKGVPGTMMLAQNFPNPFNPATSIVFGLAHAAPVTLEVFNVLGQKVRTLAAGSIMTAAFHTIQWDGRDDQGLEVGGGMYFCRLRAGTFVSTMKMMLAK